MSERGCLGLFCCNFYPADRRPILLHFCLFSYNLPATLQVLVWLCGSDEQSMSQTPEGVPHNNGQGGNESAYNPFHPQWPPRGMPRGEAKRRVLAMVGYAQFGPP